MSQTNPVSMGATVRTDPREAIARAAKDTGVDFGYLLAQARIESRLDPTARAQTSSAAGLYQFTRQTWLETLDRHGEAHGLGWAEAAIDKGRVSDPALRAQIMALRFDPEISARMAAEFAGDNSAALEGVLGRAPDSAELYLAHFLGAEGAGRFLTALAADPAQSAADLLPAAARANRAIFFDGGSPRTLGGMMGLIRGKLADAMGDTQGMPSHQAGGLPGAIATSPADPPQRATMAETLVTAFGGAARAPEAVRAAYGKLRAFGL